MRSYMFLEEIRLNFTGEASGTMHPALSPRNLLHFRVPQPRVEEHTQTLLELLDTDWNATSQKPQNTITAPFEGLRLGKNCTEAR